ncbi:MAG: class I SAM-dependent methyltransferase [Chloroflexi bacterium]|nr:class I SAM-dependent methyltransferase [Chloroflexota bacterium]
MSDAKENLGVESWLSAQAESMVLSWEKSMERFYPQYVADWTDPAAHCRALTEQWNTLAAAQCLDWNQYLYGAALRILDLGAGTGWLSIMLSKRENVERIYALDASPTNLKVMLPALAERMGGNLDRITPVLALFTPILVKDGFFDAVVASSSVHHAPDLMECLREVYRVLRPDGFFIILNEQPYPYVPFVTMAARRILRIITRVMLRQWQPNPKWLSESGLLTDPFLGDRAYASWQWKRALEMTGYSFQTVVTPYHAYKLAGDRRNKTRLTHFIARKPGHGAR